MPSPSLIPSGGNATASVDLPSPQKSCICCASVFVWCASLAVMLSWINALLCCFLRWSSDSIFGFFCLHILYTLFCWKRGEIALFNVAIKSYSIRLPLRLSFHLSSGETQCCKKVDMMIHNGRSAELHPKLPSAGERWSISQRFLGVVTIQKNPERFRKSKKDKIALI